MFTKKKSSAIKSGASAAPKAQPAPVMSGTSSNGNPAVAKHIKKQHVAHNKGMQASPPLTGAAPASSVPVMTNPYVSHTQGPNY